jgi:transposase
VGRALAATLLGGRGRPRYRSGAGPAAGRRRGTGPGRAGQAGRPGTGAVGRARPQERPRRPTVTPAGAPAVTRWQLATELVADARQLEQRIAAVEVRIKTAVAQSNTSLVQLFGVGPVLAATFLGEVGDVRRFPTKHHFAAHTGTAPLEASSGQAIRHRLSRAGDRKLNHALYMMAMVQVRRPSPSRPTTSAN